MDTKEKMKMIDKFVYAGIAALAAVFLFASTGCATSKRRVVHRPAWNLQIGMKDETIAVKNSNGIILEIANNGRVWTWIGSPEDAVIALIELSFKSIVEVLETDCDG